MRRLEFINGTIDGLMLSLRINECLMIQLLSGQVCNNQAHTTGMINTHKKKKWLENVWWRALTHQFYAADEWQTPSSSSLPLPVIFWQYQQFSNQLMYSSYIVFGLKSFIRSWILFFNLERPQNPMEFVSFGFLFLLQVCLSQRRSGSIKLINGLLIFIFTGPN